MFYLFVVPQHKKKSKKKMLIKKGIIKRSIKLNQTNSIHALKYYK